MVKGIDLLSEIATHMKYAKYNAIKGRRETWKELCDRNMSMHIKKYPNMEKEIKKTYKDFVVPKKILPSMRSMQFAGKPIELAPNRLFNCSYLPIDNLRSMSELMFLLLGGSGVGYSVQKMHVDKLPEVKKPTRNRRYVVNDSIEGWADAVKMLLKSYLEGKSNPVFDFTDIREKGAPLITSGGKAPGPEPLKECLFNLRKILDRKKDGEKLTTLEVHDMCCYIADSVLAGGIRRAALISFFDIDDSDMLTCKFGSWWELHPQRARANNSAVVVRHKVKKKDFFSLWEKVQASGSGEPGIVFTNNPEVLSNPCFTGDTMLKTEDGFKKFSELSGKEELSLVNKNGDVVKGKVWSNGNKDIVSVKFNSGETIKCTPDHRFMLSDGRECVAKELKGNRVMPFFTLRTDNNAFTELGFIQGDGSLGRLNSDSHKGMEVFIGKKDKDIATLFKIDYEEGKTDYYIRGYNDVCRDLKFDSSVLPERTLPKTYGQWSLEQKSGFLRGLFSANGSVIKGKRVSFKGTCLTLINQLKNSLKNDFGIDSYVTTNKPKEVKFSNGNYVCRESYDLNIIRFKSIISFAENIGFVHTYKNEELANTIKSKSPLVTTVKESGNEEVFDFTLYDDIHWGVVSSKEDGDGFIAHNCCEIALRPYSFCNLCEINASDIDSQEELNKRAKAASFLGTLQAGYTNFHYLRDIWKKTTERDALLGVSMTGIASNKVFKCDMKEAAKVVVEENKRVAKEIGIREAARTTCVKPAGTTSLVLGCSSGIHAWHSKYYIRRIRVGKNEAIYGYLSKNNPDLLEDDFFKPNKDAVISIPVKAPKGATFRDESALDLLERVKRVSTEWVREGHIKGDNTHNVSATVSVKEGEWDEVGKWMWDNKECYNGLSVLPYDGGTYKQAPFEEISEYMYNKLSKGIKPIDLSKVKEEDDNTDLSGELACAGGSCEWTGK